VLRNAGRLARVLQRHGRASDAHGAKRSNFVRRLRVGARAFVDQYAYLFSSRQHVSQRQRVARRRHDHLVADTSVCVRARAQSEHWLRTTISLDVHAHCIAPLVRRVHSEHLRTATTTISLTRDAPPRAHRRDVARSVSFERRAIPSQRRQRLLASHRAYAHRADRTRAFLRACDRAPRLGSTVVRRHRVHSLRL
jgi:hypothetical protein